MRFGLQLLVLLVVVVRVLWVHTLKKVAAIQTELLRFQTVGLTVTHVDAKRASDHGEAVPSSSQPASDGRRRRDLVTKCVVRTSIRGNASSRADIMSGDATIHNKVQVHT